MGDDLCREIDIGCLLVSIDLSAPTLTLIGHDEIKSCRPSFTIKLSPEMGDFDFYWISRRHRDGFSNSLELHIPYRATVIASNVQALINSS